MFKKLVIISVVMIALGQSAFSQKKVSPAAKKLAVQLATQSIDLFPVKIFEDTLKTKSESATAEIESDLISKLSSQLEQSNLTDERKSEIKLKFPDFAKGISSKISKLLSDGFQVNAWTKKSLEKHYSEQFTLAELQRLNAYFKTNSGKNFIKVFNEQVSGGMNGQDSEFESEKDKLFEKFAKTVGMSTFEKFTEVLIAKVMDDITASVDKWGEDLQRNLEKETGERLTGEIQKFMSQISQ